MASAGDSSGQMSAKNPVFCIKQLYNGAEGWTVEVVAKILNYRGKKVVEIINRIPPNLDSIQRLWRDIYLNLKVLNILAQLILQRS